MVEIQIATADVMYLLDQARRVSSKIGVIGVDSLVNSVKRIAPILGLEVFHFALNSPRIVEKLVNEAAARGAEVIVGASAAVTLARNRGLEAILLRSSEDSVLAALHEAVRIKSALQSEAEWGLRQKAVLESISDGLLTLDEYGHLSTFNRVAAKELNLSPDHLGRKPDFISGLGLEEALKHHRPVEGQLLTINKTPYVVQVRPILSDRKALDTVISFQKVDELQRLEQTIRRRLSEKGHVARYHFEDLVADDPLSGRLLAKARNYAQVDSTILIEGESGTGKEGLAQSIHSAGPRSAQPFVAINCLALPETLLESELFGFKEGAFTGARKGGKPGLLEMAHKGTLFLDEIAEISPGFQARLLRVLEERVVQRLGDDKIIPIDVRIVTATNQPLRRLVAEKKFREDLFYRLNVLNLILPPLRERRGDIPGLVSHFLDYFSRRLQRPRPNLSAGALDLLTAFDYPGNVRQLRNIVERLVVSSSARTVEPWAVEEAIGPGFCPSVPLAGEVKGQGRLRAEEEIRLFKRVISECGGNKAEAARRLGVSPTTLWRKLGRSGS